MEKIKTSLFGYNKTNVDNIIREKEEMINTQKKILNIFNQKTTR